MTELLSADYVRDRLEYNPNTGVFVWRKTRKAEFIGTVAGNDKHGRTRIQLKRVNYMAHRLAWLHVTGDWPKYHIDHINGDATDNRFENLRDVPQQINAQNRRSAKGYSVNKWGTFQVHIKVPDAAVIHVGNYRTADEAHDAYLRAKRRLHPGCTV